MKEICDTLYCPTSYYIVLYCTECRIDCAFWSLTPFRDSAAQGHTALPSRAVEAVERGVRYLDSLLQPHRRALGGRPVPDAPEDFCDVHACGTVVAVWLPFCGVRGVRRGARPLTGYVWLLTQGKVPNAMGGAKMRDLCRQRITDPTTHIHPPISFWLSFHTGSAHSDTASEIF